jgi:hypothetical protein
MALSVQSLRGSPICSLGFVKVTTSGTPVPLSINIDANNTNAPGTANPPPASFPGPGMEWTPVFRGFAVQGFKPGSGNNGMVANTGNIYLLMAAAGGTGNKNDSGAIVKVIQPSGDYFFPSPNPGCDMFSPYYLYLDADVSGEGGLVTAYGGGNP